MWISVVLYSDAAHAEALGDALLEQGALSVTAEDADAGSEREQPQFGEPGADHRPLWQNSRLDALFDADADITAKVAAAAAAAGLAQAPAWTQTPVAQQNWVQLTQSQFAPIRIGEGLWIVPSWHTAPDASAINIELDPGMAFGTGSHPTTRLCLQWLRERGLAGRSVLDYGTGSGILAIAAAKLGAASVVGVDIDDAALEAAAHNAQRNSVSIDLLHSRSALDMQFDCVIANILTNPLRVLAPLLAARMAPGGDIALSGILESQAAEVCAAYRPFVNLTVAARAEGWVLLQGTRP